MSLTGNPVLKTPNMDRLAREGVQFTNFHVDSYCTPTRSALMTGRYCHRVGGWGTISGRNMLRDDEVTMADVFRHNGYRTGHFGKWHLGTNYPYRPIDRGFDEWLGHGDGGTGCTTDYWGNDRVNDHYIHNGRWEDQPRPGFEGDVFFDAAMQFIRDNKNRPFFTYLAVYNPHSPCSIADPKWAGSLPGQGGARRFLRHHRPHRREPRPAAAVSSRRRTGRQHAVDLPHRQRHGRGRKGFQRRDARQERLAVRRRPSRSLFPALAGGRIRQAGHRETG